MATRREEKERLRQLRLEKEERQRKTERKRVVLGSAVAGVVLVVVIAVIVVVAVSSGGGAASGPSHINVESGSTNGVPPDGRSGTEPQPVKATDLKTAARQAGCTLRLGLSDEGSEHIAPGSPTPPYETNPPTSGPHVEPPYQQADGAYSKMPEEIDFVHSLEHGRMEIQYSPSLPEKDQLALKGLYDSMYSATLLTEDAIRDFGKETWGKYGGEPPEAFPFNGPTPADPAA